MATLIGAHLIYELAYKPFLPFPRYRSVFVILYFSNWLHGVSFLLGHSVLVYLVIIHTASFREYVLMLPYCLFLSGDDIFSTLLSISFISFPFSYFLLNKSHFKIFLPLMVVLTHTYFCITVIISRTQDLSYWSSIRMRLPRNQYIVSHWLSLMIWFFVLKLPRSIYDRRFHYLFVIRFMTRNDMFSELILSKLCPIFHSFGFSIRPLGRSQCT